MSSKKTSKAAGDQSASSGHPFRSRKQATVRSGINTDGVHSAREERDSSRLVRMATHHHAPTQSSKLAAKASMRPRRPTESSTGSASSTREASGNERRERKRKQNTESARRMRELRRKETAQLEQAFDANEVRINELEVVADELSRELRRHNTISSVGRTSRGGPAFEVPEERPGWFGAPF